MILSCFKTTVELRNNCWETDVAEARTLVFGHQFLLFPEGGCLPTLA
jgi:hypothetical protein